MRELRARGYAVTQATLSRDLKMLRTTKIPTDMGGYRYVITEHPVDAIIAPDALDAQAAVSPSAALSVARSGNILVFKTRAGYAGGLAYDIDMIDSPLILGTIAGADTVFAAVARDASDRDLSELLAGVLPAEIITDRND